MSRTNAINRVVLAVIGLLLLAAGGLGLAVSAGAFGGWRATAPVLPRKVDALAEGRPWFWWAVAGVLLLIAVLAVLWLLAQFKTDRKARLDLTADARDGYTTLHARALTDAVEDEAAGILGVTGVSASIREHRGDHCYLRVDLADSADIPGVRTQLENEIVEHLREGAGDPTFPVTIELRPGASRSRERSLA